MYSAEDNCRWVRDKIEQRGWSDEIRHTANIRWIARHASEQRITELFNEIVKDFYRE